MRCTLGSIAVTGPCSNWLIHNPISQADSAVSRPHPPYINHMFRHMQFPKQLTGTLSPAIIKIFILILVLIKTSKMDLKYEVF